MLSYSNTKNSYVENTSNYINKRNSEDTKDENQ